jgi:hypothetical protein
MYRLPGTARSAPRLVGISIALLACWPSSSMAQSQHRAVYDGRWVANVPPQGACPASRLTLHVRGSSIRGTAANPSGVFPIRGSLGGEGSGTIQILEMGGTIRLSRNRFVARYFNVCGPRHAVGVRTSLRRSGTEPI